MTGNITDDDRYLEYEDLADDDEILILRAGAAVGKITGATLKALIVSLGGGGEGGVADGDKGDITVSSSGLVWNIDAGAVGTNELAAGAVTAEKVAADVATQLELDAEVTARANADTALDGRLDTAESTLSGLGTAADRDTGTTEGTIPLLGAGGKLSLGIIPATAITDVYPVADITARDALTVQEGDVAIVLDATADPDVDVGGATYIQGESGWERLLVPGDLAEAVQIALSAHEADTANPHAVTKAQVGLDQVANLAPPDLPISDDAQAALDLKANLASPTLTGTPAAPTPATADSSTKIPTTEYVVNRIQQDTAEVGPGDYIGFADEGGVQVPVPLPGLVYVTHNYDSTATNVANTTTEGDLTVAPWTIPADEIVVGTTIYELLIRGQYTNNSGSNRDLTLRFKHGSTTLMSTTFSAVPTGASGRVWTFQALIKPTFFGSNIWGGSGTFTLGAAGDGALLHTRGASIAGLNAVDITIANDLEFTAQHSAAASTIAASMTVGIVKRVA